LRQHSAKRKAHGVEKRDIKTNRGKTEYFNWEVQWISASYTLSAGHGFANSVTRKKPTDKFTGVFGVHQFL